MVHHCPRCLRVLATRSRVLLPKLSDEVPLSLLRFLEKLYDMTWCLSSGWTSMNITMSNFSPRDFFPTAWKAWGLANEVWAVSGYVLPSRKLCLRPCSKGSTGVWGQNPRYFFLMFCPKAMCETHWKHGLLQLESLDHHFSTSSPCWQWPLSLAWYTGWGPTFFFFLGRSFFVWVWTFWVRRGGAPVWISDVWLEDLAV